MLYRFNLYTFENPTGRDTLLDGYMSPGKNPDVLFGMPYPFFNASGSPENPAYPPQKSAMPEPSAMAPSNVPKEIDIHESASGKSSPTSPEVVPVPKGK